MVEFLKALLDKLPPDTATIVVVVILAFLGWVWLDRRFRRFDSELTSVARATRATMTAQGTLIGILAKQNAIGGPDVQDIQKAYTESLGNDLDTILTRERRHKNPLTLEEVDRLDSYVQRARAGQLFTAEQVQDYTELVAKMEREHPNDAGVWALVALGAFLFGLYLAGGAKNRRV